MRPESHVPDSTVRSTEPSNELQAIRVLASRVAAEATLACAAEVLSVSLARLLNAPLALLSRDSLAWRFETYAFPDAATTSALTKFEQNVVSEDPLRQLQEDSGHDWTAIALGTLGDREWTLLLPGRSSRF
jgi:hypothetical protein